MCRPNIQNAAQATPAPPPQSPEQAAPPTLQLLPKTKGASKARAALLTLQPAGASTAQGAGLQLAPPTAT